MGNRLSRYRTLLRKAHFAVMRNGFRRADYLRKHQVLQEIGQHVYYYSRNYPDDPRLLKLHNNVVIATGVRFICHDRIDILLSGLYDRHYTKSYGCIEVMDNVFIGADVSILPNVRIGPNAVIGAGAIVTRDVPPGTVVAGVPARVIGSFDELVAARKDTLHPESGEAALWAVFDQARQD